MKKIGIITWHYYSNFGSALQSYALQHYLQKNNCNVTILNYRNSLFCNNSWSYEKARSIVSNLAYYFPSKIKKRFYSAYLSFRYKYMNESQIVLDEEGLANISKGFDAVICGSDQIWAPNVFNSIYLLPFVKGKTKKISYAASLGMNNLPNKLIGEYSRLLKTFDAISVRENVGKMVLKELCNVESDVVLDPTFLLSRDEWMTIENDLQYYSQPYIFCYFLNENNAYKSIVLSYAKKNNLNVVGFSANKSDYEWMDNSFDWAGPSEFLSLIHNAECVFTDSYHGTIFSMLYHKTFYTFERFNSNDPINQNSRIYQLDKWFGMADRIVTDKHSIESCKDFDYEVFESNLKKARKISFDFLREALADA